jgi:uncharacterized membrane protein
MSSFPREPDEVAQLREQLEQVRREMLSFGDRLGDLEAIVVRYFEPGVARTTAKSGLGEVQIREQSAIDGALPPAPEAAKSAMASTEPEEMVSQPSGLNDPAIVPLAESITSESDPNQPLSPGADIAASDDDKLSQEPRSPRSPIANDGTWTSASSQPQVAIANSLAKKLTIPAQVDWETLIGGRWMTWVGAFTLLLAVGFGVHWAWSTFHTPPWLQVLGFHLLGVGFLVGGYVVRRRGLPVTTQALVGLNRDLSPEHRGTYGLS